MIMLQDHVYTELFNEDEMWFICGPGKAVVIYDIPLLDA